jgi:hypothetical protein
MAEENRDEPLTRRRPGENRGHHPAVRAGSARLPEDVLRRALSAIRSGTDAPAEAAETSAARGAPDLPSRRGRALGFGPGADGSTQPIPALPASDEAPASPVAETPPARSRARRYRIAGAAAAVVAVIAAVTAALAMLSPSPARRHDQPATVRGLAAAWIAGQLSRSGIISCDPVMCAALRRRGVPAADLLALTQGHGDPLHSAVIVATAAVRADLGGRLATADAPGMIAAFGSAAARIEVRAVAARGPAAFQAALRADLTQRRESGAELLGSDRITVIGAARRELAAGDVDARLLVILAALGAQHRIDVVSFSDGGPGASLSVSPYRAAELTQATAASDPAFAPSVLSFLRSQHPPFAAALVQRIRLTASRTAVRVRFAAPSPLDLLSGSAAPPGG